MSEENGMNRLIMPDEVATLAKLLVSDAGKMIDGEIVHISGEGVEGHLTFVKKTYLSTCRHCESNNALGIWPQCG